MTNSFKTAALAAGLGLGLAANVAAQEMPKDIESVNDYTKVTTIETLEGGSKIKSLTDNIKFQ
jgi:hypothetical protein